MAKGDWFPSESKAFRDSETGAPVRQVTAQASIHHQPFFFVSAYDDAMQWLFLVSHRTGRAEIFAEDRSTGKLRQLTDRPDLNEWSIYPSHDGAYVYFTAGQEACRLKMDDLVEETLVDLSEFTFKEKGYVGAAMGTTALSFDDRYWALRVSQKGCSRIIVVDTASRKHGVILERDSIAHMMFCPDDSDLLFYAGPLTDRVWCVRKDGRENRRVYQRTNKDQWITHETWLPGTGELMLVDWPKGMLAVDPTSGTTRRLTDVNAWHAVANRDGTRVVADTNSPDRGIVVFDPRDQGLPVRTLCYPKSSNQGDHWNGPFPYNNGPISVYAPQHTHPHPNFSPDGKFVCYTSDESGHAQVYEAELLSS